MDRCGEAARARHLIAEGMAVFDGSLWGGCQGSPPYRRGNGSVRWIVVGRLPGLATLSPREWQCSMDRCGEAARARHLIAEGLAVFDGSLWGGCQGSPPYRRGIGSVRWIVVG